jgi:hypothetical protein
MRPVTARFLDAVGRSHRVSRQVEILSAGEVLGDPVTAVSGTVTLDSTSAIRGRCDLTFIDDGSIGIVPSLSTDRLAPYGNEIRVSRGIQYPDGTTELVALGVFGIQSVDVDDTTDGLEVRVVGLDRSQRVIDARFEEPYQVEAATNYATAIENVIDAGVPGLTYSFPTITTTTPLLVAAEGDDRWAFAQEMARSLGMILFLDGDGAVVVEPISTPAGTPALALAEGADGVLVSAGKGWTREGAFNRVIATGENTGEGAPVRGVATDTNTASPTCYFGPFGKVPRFYVSQFITTTAQAEDAAAGMLAKELGTSQTIRFGAVVNPALEPNDIVQVTRQRAGFDESHVVDSVTIPLDVAGTMTGQTRAVQVT